MAIGFPIDITNGWDIIASKIERGSYDIPEQIEISQTGAGEVLQADLGPMLWTADVKLAPLLAPEASPIEGLLDVLRPAGRTLYVYDHRRPYPALDTLGAALTGFSPVIYDLQSNTRDMKISGLPAFYRLSAGDYIAFDYSGTRRALHRVVPALVTAFNTGITPWFEVVPAIRPGAAVGAAVTLIKAAFKAQTVPGSISKGQTEKTVTTGMTFRLIQTTGL